MIEQHEQPEQVEPTYTSRYNVFGDGGQVEIAAGDAIDAIEAMRQGVIEWTDEGRAEFEARMAAQLDLAEPVETNEGAPAGEGAPVEQSEQDAPAAAATGEGDQEQTVEQQAQQPKPSAVRKGQNKGAPTADGK